MADGYVDIYAEYMRIVKEAEKKREEMIKKKTDEIHAAEKKANELFIATLRGKLEKMYKETIDAFYSNYSKKYYKRTESLYNLMEITKVDDVTIHIEFNPDKMVKYRDGGSGGEGGLYDLVFREGYHGGAKSGEGHPDEGTPYWRKPVPGYYRWGRPASHSEPPLDDMNARIDEYEANEINKDMFDAWAKAAPSLKDIVQIG